MESWHRRGGLGRQRWKRQFAGTYGYWTIESPGNDPYVITVGAVNTKATPDRSDDAMTSYSAKGPTAFDHIVKPDLVAPGIGLCGSTLLVSWISKSAEPRSPELLPKTLEVRRLQQLLRLEWNQHGGWNG